VAFHYDDLDEVYQQVWGGDLHHGLWEDGVGSSAEAGKRMTRFYGERLNLQAGESLWDVGCGYGQMAADLVAKYGVEAGGTTISRRQWEQAVAGEDVRLGDWLRNDLPGDSFDAVLAVESLEHMSEPRQAVMEMARVLKPGGRLVLGCWLSGDRLAGWEQRVLVDPTCRDGLLHGLAKEKQIRGWLCAAGLELDRTDDLSRQVEKTWLDCLRRTGGAAISNPGFRHLVCADPGRSMRMAFALKRIWIAYLLGAMRYVVFSAGKPL
jgi:tocopherol O-methyltransferase